MNKQYLNELLLPVSNIAVQAGILINTFYKTHLKISYKDNKSPLTEADMASNKYIINSLLKLNSDIPILSEETLVEWRLRKDWSKYWLVDPLDGTKEFINQNDEFTVNIALIENNYPVLGVIYAPALSLLYYANLGGGSYKLNPSSEIKSLTQSIKIRCKKKNKSDKINIIGSKSHFNQEVETWAKKNFAKFDIIKKGSSLKFCEIAEGKVDIYPRFGPTSEWDIAAGNIILSEAGGNIKSLDGKKILYNNKESIVNPSFVAYGNINN